MSEAISTWVIRDQRCADRYGGWLGAHRRPLTLQGLSRKTLTLTEDQEGVRNSKEEMKECLCSGEKLVQRPRGRREYPGQIYHKQPGTVLVLRPDKIPAPWSLNEMGRGQ